MKNRLLIAVSFIAFFFMNVLEVKAQYKECMDENGFTVDLQKDYGLENDNAAKPQGHILQDAINEVTAKKNGGNIFIPKGIYDITGVSLKSNVHILIEKGTVIKVVKASVGAKGLKKDKVKSTVKSKDTKGVVFKLDFEDVNAKGKNKGDGSQYIENVSVRGVGGPFVIDYHHLKSQDKQRAFVVKMVKNFLIENVDVKDNYTVYCGTSFGPSSSKGDVSDWEVSRPTDGLVRNYRLFRGSPGYGGIQLHGAQSVHFENIYSLGGVSFRLEVGANNKNVGIFDITAKNIICEDGKKAVLMGPHSAKNGVVTIDGITSLGCASAISFGEGHVKKGAPDQTPGYFDSRSSVKNIHAVYGPEAQIKRNGIAAYPDAKYLEELKIWSDGKFFSGPSIGVLDYKIKSYKVSVDNVSWSGFPYEPTQEDGKSKSNIMKSWLEAHQGAQWVSDKGVVANDYEIETPKQLNLRLKKVMELETITMK